MCLFGRKKEKESKDEKAQVQAVKREAFAKRAREPI